jgi:hypothetical protein
LTATSASALVILFALVTGVGCGPDDAPQVSDLGGLADVGEADAGPLDVRVDHGPRPTDASDAEILYPGYPCEADEACSTGLCYGTATAQGAFEPAECQVACLGLNDFRHYCDSDRDCCSRRCCLDCGPKQGLCVLAPPVSPE